MKNISIDLGYNPENGAQLLYAVDANVLSLLMGDINSSSIISNIKNATLTEDIGEAILSIRAYPLNVLQLFGLTGGNYTRRYLSIGDWTSPDREGYLLHGVAFADLGTIGIYPKYGTTYDEANFYDFEPYTQLKLWLPYIGIVDLPLNHIMGKYINIQYKIDIAINELTAYIRCADSSADASDYNKAELVAIFTGKIGVDVPFTRTNGHETAMTGLMGIIKMGIGAIETGAGAITKNPYIAIRGVTQLIQGGSDYALPMTHYQNDAGGGSYSYWFCSQSAFLIWYRPQLIPTNYNNLFGFPCHQVIQLGNISGYANITKIFSYNFNNATKEEIELIKTTLSNGVIL